MVTVESLKNKIDKNNGNFDDLNDWERILKRRVNKRIRARQNSHTLEQYGIDISLLDKHIDITHKHFVITSSPLHDTAKSHIFRFRRPPLITSLFLYQMQAKHLYFSFFIVGILAITLKYTKFHNE